MAPNDNRLASRFGSLEKLYEEHHKIVQDAPAISPNTAATLSVLFTLFYIIPFYLSPLTRPSSQVHRDAPKSISAKVATVRVSTLLCLGVTVYVLHQYGHATPWEILKCLGFWPCSFVDIAKTMLLVGILFAGPLFEAGIVDGNLKDWLLCRHVVDTFSTWIGYRNYVVGPISEEIIWRGILIPLHLLAGFSGKETIFLTPLYFGIAHFHHMYEFRVRNPDAPLIVAVARSLVQFTYTSLFGFFAAFIFLRTGNIYAAMLAHTFCNWMGLPRLWGRVGVAAGAPIGPPDVGYPEGGDRGDGSKSLGWTVAYYVILFAGAYGFYKGLFPLTDSSNALPVVLLGE